MATISIQQELTNIIVKKVAMKQLDLKSKLYYRTGQKMGKVYINWLMKDTNILFGEIEMICKVGLV